MSWDSGRVASAIADGSRFAGDINLTLWIALGFWTIILSLMAYFAVPTQWMIVVAVVAACSTMGSIIIPAIRRLDAGRAYLENTCHEIELKLDYK